MLHANFSITAPEFLISLGVLRDSFLFCNCYKDVSCEFDHEFLILRRWPVVWAPRGCGLEQKHRRTENDPSPAVSSLCRETVASLVPAGSYYEAVSCRVVKPFRCLR